MDCGSQLQLQQQYRITEFGRSEEFPRIPWNSAETWKFRGNGQIPRPAENCGPYIWPTKAVSCFAEMQLFFFQFCQYLHVQYTLFVATIRFLKMDLSMDDDDGEDGDVDYWVPTPPEKSGFFPKFSRTWVWSWKVAGSLNFKVMESTGIYLWFELTTVPFTRGVQKVRRLT